MPLSRHLPLLVRLVLVAWLLALGSAMAASAAKPASLEMICSGGVMKLMAQGQDDPAPSPDCPLCALPGLLPDTPPAGLGLMAAGGGLAPAGEPAPFLRPAGFPPPARGPPRIFLA